MRNRIYGKDVSILMSQRMSGATAPDIHKTILPTITETLTEALDNNGFARIPDFGKFVIFYGRVRARAGFKPSPTLKQLINQ